MFDTKQQHSLRVLSLVTCQLLGTIREYIVCNTSNQWYHISSQSIQTKTSTFVGDMRLYELQFSVRDIMQSPALDQITA